MFRSVNGSGDLDTKSFTSHTCLNGWTRLLYTQFSVRSINVLKYEYKSLYSLNSFKYMRHWINCWKSFVFNNILTVCFLKKIFVTPCPYVEVIKSILVSGKRQKFLNCFWIQSDLKFLLAILCNSCCLPLISMLVIHKLLTQNALFLHPTQSYYSFVSSPAALKDHRQCISCQIFTRSLNEKLILRKKEAREKINLVNVQPSDKPSLEEGKLFFTVPAVFGFIQYSVWMSNITEVTWCGGAADTNFFIHWRIFLLHFSLF